MINWPIVDYLLKPIQIGLAQGETVQANSLNTIIIIIFVSNKRGVGYLGGLFSWDNHVYILGMLGARSGWDVGTLGGRFFFWIHNYLQASHKIFIIWAYKGGRPPSTRRG